MRKTFIACAFAFTAMAGISSCNNASKGEQAAPTAEQTSTAADSASVPQTQQLAYICPMECEGSASMQPGKCPVCGMDLEKNPTYQGTADSTDTE